MKASLFIIKDINYIGLNKDIFTYENIVCLEKKRILFFSFIVIIDLLLLGSYTRLSSAVIK